ncbi:bacterial regulatory helix-turn-helix protein, AraC family protein [Asticcacaulis biprosthecium C19]|uniref:Bacterial regulatory helix-turn-helix protein, AraC family protein n=1 Tax=Asticcacaulis biprosthecium C19 TaxID=715226 RepID=F4QNT3_9CAUL|nr:bacterial regulatory helix-turn-helix protein, AraC family protein [Asticcacaulis biprosthecium C19]
MDTTLLLVLAAATWAQAAFCICVLARKTWDTPAYAPLAALFAILCFASGGPVVAAFAPQAEKAFYELTVPAYLLVTPVLWTAFEGFTSETRWRFEARHLPYLAPPATALVLVLLDIFVAEAPVGYVVVVAVLWAGTLGLWLWQTGRMVFTVMTRLPVYRQRLKALFSEGQGELNGAEAIAMAILTLWLIVLIAVVLRNMTGASFLPDWTVAVLFLALTWSLGGWALHQKPGFEGRYVTADSSESEKYQKSALADAQGQRIADRLKAAMETDKLYLDPTLSLPKLARHLHVSGNHISQTLNGVIGLSFFDYVTRWRVEAAKPEVLAGAKGILEIAYDNGFNARSSFYRAFKRETGMTPTEYRDRGGVT